MDVRAWTFVCVGLSFAVYIGIAIWSKANSTSEFYVAGGKVPPVLNGMATAADWMSAASFISMAGLISFMGRDGAVYLMGWTGGYVLLALLLAPYLSSHLHLRRRPPPFPTKVFCNSALAEKHTGFLHSRRHNNQGYLIGFQLAVR